MVFEDHGMTFPCTELLLFNYAKVNTVFHSMAPLKHLTHVILEHKTRCLNNVWTKTAETIKSKGCNSLKLKKDNGVV